MEYTKDMILDLHYGQVKKGVRKGLLGKALNSILKHRVMTTIICITLMLIILDLMLVSSFIQVLSLL